VYVCAYICIHTHTWTDRCFQCPSGKFQLFSTNWYNKNTWQPSSKDFQDPESMCASCPGGSTCPRSTAEEKKTSDSLLAFTSFLTKDFGSIAKYFLRSLALFLTRMGSWRHLDVQAVVTRKIVTRSSAASRQQRSRRIDAHHKCVSTKATGLLRGQNV
jgi:hypothetical protein